VEKAKRTTPRPAPYLFLILFFFKYGFLWLQIEYFCCHSSSFGGSGRMGCVLRPSVLCQFLLNKKKKKERRRKKEYPLL